MDVIMNLTQLTVFREVMQSGSISQTARKLNRTQPAISLALKNLEKSLDISLFERRGRRLIPVPEAQYLLAEATAVLDRLDTVSGTLRELRNAQAGSLSVAAMPGPSAYILPRFISRNVPDMARSQISFASRSSGQVRELASTQSIDFGFADVIDVQGAQPQYTAQVISADCYCALHVGHPLAGHARLGVRELDGIAMGTLYEGHPLVRQLHKTFEDAGASFVTTIAAQFFLPLIPFIAQGQCVAIVDPLTVVTERHLDSARGQIVFVPFDAPFRYDYATLTPAHRPLSVFAAQLKDKWHREVFDTLTDLGARPRAE